MSYYFMVSITVTDPDEYKKYLEQAGDIFARYRGTYLAVDDNPQVLEGTWDSERAVLIRFDSREDFKDWYHSKAYQEILQYRLPASHGNAILIKGRD